MNDLDLYRPRPPERRDPAGELLGALLLGVLVVGVLGAVLSAADDSERRRLPAVPPPPPPPLPPPQPIIEVISLEDVTSGKKSPRSSYNPPSVYAPACIASAPSVTIIDSPPVGFFSQQIRVSTLILGALFISLPIMAFFLGQFWHEKTLALKGPPAAVSGMVTVASSASSAASVPSHAPVRPTDIRRPSGRLKN